MSALTSDDGDGDDDGDYDDDDDDDDEDDEWTLEAQRGARCMSVVRRRSD